MTFVERRGRARQGICTSSASARQTQLMTKVENVYNSSKSACTWTRDLTQHHFFITKQHFLARILREWRQQMTGNLNAWTPRRWELKRTLFDPSTFVDINWERAETWIATRFQNEFESLLNLSKGSNHEAKFVHTNWSKIIKVGTQTNECDICAGTSI